MWCRWIVIAVVAAALTGCPKTKRRTLVPSLPTSGDASARSRFQEAKARFERDARDGAGFQAIVREFPDDPIAPFAQLYAGVAASNAGDHAGAVKILSELVGKPGTAEGLVRRGELYLGISLAHRGEHAQAAPLLARSEPAVETEAERGLWLAALSISTAALDPLASLPWFDRWWLLAAPAERGYILVEVGAIVAKLPPDALAAPYHDLAKSGPAAAILGWRLADELERKGELALARGVRDELTATRHKIGLATPQREEGDDGSQPGLVAALVALDGKQARVGEAALRGLAVASGALGLGDGDAAMAVMVSEVADGRIADAVDTAAARGAIAVLGPVDNASAEAAVARAAQRQLPIITLSPRPEGLSSNGWSFHIMHSAEMRARSLGRRALGRGLKRFAVLAPDSGYGKAVKEAFAAEVRGHGGEVVVEQVYPDSTVSFAAVVKQLSGSWQAVFVADRADKLELIAPALTAAGMVPRPVGSKKPRSGTPIVLISTAEGAGSDYLRDAGRYSEGALLAPGFFPDGDDELIGPFVERYLRAGGVEPTAIDAYAYDAVQMVGAAAATGRAALSQDLARRRHVGVTGTVQFGAEHRRSDEPLVFVVESDGAGGYRAKAMR